MRLRLRFLACVVSSFFGFYKPREGIKDGWKWRPTTDGIFQTKKAYEQLVEGLESTTTNAPSPEELQLVWNKLAPAKTTTMAWRLLWNRLPTLENLARRNIIHGTTPTNCPVCGILPETANHAFLGCIVAAKVWANCYNWLDIPVVLHNQVNSHFLLHSGIFPGKRSSSIATGLWICVVWVIWNWRNKKVFEGATVNAEKITDEIKGRFWSWYSAKFPTSGDFSLKEWFTCPRNFLNL